MTNLDQKLCVKPNETPLPITYLKTSGASKNIEASTTGATEPNPDLYYYAPSSGYMAKISNLTLGVGDNTAWVNVKYFGDYSAALTLAIKIQIRRGNGSVETIATFSSTLDIIRQFMEFNLDFLYPGLTNDRIILAYLRFSKTSPPILNGTRGDKITVSIFETLAPYAIKKIHCTIAGVTYAIA